MKQICPYDEFDVINKELIQLLRLDPEVTWFFDVLGLNGMPLSSLKEIDGDIQEVFAQIRKALINPDDKKAVYCLDDKGRLNKRKYNYGIEDSYFYSQDSKKLSCIMRGSEILSKVTYDGDSTIITRSNDVKVYEKGLLTEIRTINGTINYKYDKRLLLEKISHSNGFNSTYTYPFISDNKLVIRRINNYGELKVLEIPLYKDITLLKYTY